MGLFGGSKSTTEITYETSNVTQGVQDGGIIANAGGDINYQVTDANAVAEAFGFGSNALDFSKDTTDSALGFGREALDYSQQSQALAGETIDSALGLTQQQTKDYFNAFNELQTAQNSIYERGLAEAGKTRDLAFANIDATTSKIASIAQTTSGDIKPILTTAFIGLIALAGVFYVVPKFVGGR